MLSSGKTAARAGNAQSDAVAGLSARGLTSRVRGLRPAKIDVQGTIRRLVFQTMFGEVIAQRPLTDSHHFCGVFLDASRVLEHATNGLAFDPVEILLQISRWQRRLRGPVRR